MPRKYLIVFGVVALAAAVYHAVRVATADGPRAHTNDHEAQIGQSVAELVAAGTDVGQAITVLYLFPEGVAPYDARARALREKLAGHAATLNEVWAREEGHYNDDDYTRSIEIALARNPESTALVVMGVGSVTHAEVSKPLAAWLKGEGRLFLIGSAHSDAPFVKLAQQGYATLLARRTTWLKDAEPHPRLADQPDYVREHFTLIASPST